MEYFKPSPETIARTICLFAAITNEIMAILGRGRIEIAENDIYQLVSLIAIVITAVRSWWKNNSFTINAIKADAYKESLKEVE